MTTAKQWSQITGLPEDECAASMGCESISEELVIHISSARKTKRGVSIEARCCGEIEIDGERYEFNIIKRFAAKKAKR